MDEYMLNMGVPAGRVRPIDIDHLYPEKDEDLMVEVIVTASSSSKTPRDNHWMLAWELGRAGPKTVVHRRVNVVREAGVPHLTNWGALTKTASANTIIRYHSIAVKEMTRAQRVELEAIGNTTPVRKPDGKWNCQDWVVTVLKVAEVAGLVTREEWTAAVAVAETVTFS